MMSFASEPNGTT
jgi:hypothetical protein